jgi:hypothetical protein
VDIGTVFYVLPIRHRRAHLWRRETTRSSAAPTGMMFARKLASGMTLSCACKSLFTARVNLVVLQRCINVRLVQRSSCLSCSVMKSLGQVTIHQIYCWIVLCAHMWSVLVAVICIQCLFYLAIILFHDYFFCCTASLFTSTTIVLRQQKLQVGLFLVIKTHMS